MATKVKCIKKYRDKNNIIKGYMIVDVKGNSKTISSEELKAAINDGRLDVINLTLTTDGKLRDSAKSKEAVDENATDINAKAGVNRRSAWEIKGRYMSGKEVTGYYIKTTDGSKGGKYDREVIAYLVGRGQIMNAEGQLYKDKFLLRGKGCNLDQLPSKEEN